MKLLLFLLLPVFSFAQKDSGFINNQLPTLYYHNIIIHPNDTLPAILLLTEGTTRLGEARAHRGYVVLNDWGQAVKYLDCKKREIKEPGIIWDFKLNK